MQHLPYDSYLPTIIIRNSQIAVFPALSLALYVMLCSPQVNSLPFGLFDTNEWTPTLSVTATPGSNTLVHFFEVVMWISLGQEEMLGGSRSVYTKKK